MTPIEHLSDDALGGLLRPALALQDAPEPWVQAAIALWPAAGAAPLPAAAEQALRWVRAVLSHDSWAPALAPALAAGLRALPSNTRHLLFSAEGRDIDLRVAPSPNAGFSISGQILGPDDAGEVELRGLAGDAAGEAADAEPAARVVALDAWCEFRFDGVARGRYLMRLHLSGERIELPAIEVGERPG